MRFVSVRSWVRSPLGALCAVRIIVIQYVLTICGNNDFARTFELHLHKMQKSTSGLSPVNKHACACGLFNMWFASRWQFVVSWYSNNEHSLVHREITKRAHPDLNQRPADLQSAALTTELCTHLTPRPDPSNVQRLTIPQQELGSCAA